MDFAPPPEWLEVFPLLKPPFKELNNFVQWQVHPKEHIVIS